MSKGIFVVSKSSTALNFVQYNDAPANTIPKVLRSVTIKGGANVAQPKTFITPNGVLTRITQDDFDFLMKDEKFIDFMAKGFMSIISDDADVEQAARDMVKKDRSAPRTAADYGDAGKISVGSRQQAA